MGKNRALTIALILGWIAAVAPVKSSYAMDRDVRSVLTISAYGLVGGTAIGLLTYPMTHSSRSIFIGSSVGLYLGIAVGLYYISHRDDPENPLYDGRSQSLLEREERLSKTPFSPPRAEFESRYTVLSF